MTKLSLKTLEQNTDVRKAVKFLALFFLFASIAYATFYLTPLQQESTRFAAKTSQFFLSALGVETSFVESDFPHLINEDFDATINEVCSGGIELIVLFGLIFASFERSWRERVKGFLIGVVVLWVFNIARIVTTLYFLSDFLHSFLFRVLLVIVIVGYYWFWFYNPMKSVFKSRKRN